ncbi:autotransporter outer membrane beta-barrel domain-containing protein [Scandinavium lactucae]|uniref:Autotransporter outer membrane beta-barrel domain-containing protein n=1 Tax=Scandinavium lactucae TaxID=3095028 RepID=A0ABU4QUM2_9ENTR|nr:MULTISPECIES: autotransporter outer membrane beta-barrel domain-containing protein [unclassified Scandinavium]MDX6040965.1 autotransporter outer membrane beta-barrel domain-containing protein [Scandinavium sp. V105_6]MDX6050865.1 autotransporter outer membrane beta-barrel domain-containing protein [Scandinavium sp. V105_1]
MTSPLLDKPKAWYFNEPSQDAAINSMAKAQNIYFASGTASRNVADIQQLLVNGADLSGYYINASKNGSATISLANNAKVDWLEAGGASTNTRVIVDHSTLNGASEMVDYDRKTITPYSKKYANGYAIYLSVSDNGNSEVDIQNGSVIGGRILAGGAGTHDITVQDSQIQAGSILLYNTSNNNNITLENSSVDTRGAVAATANAIEITNLIKADKTQTITADNSQLTGSVVIASSGSSNTLSLQNSTVNKTTQVDGNALSLVNGKMTQLIVDNSQIGGHALLSGSDSITGTLIDSQIDGNVIANNAAKIALDITRSVLNGNINADTGTVALHLTDSSLYGDVNLNGDNITGADVWLDNTRLAGHLYGSGEASSLHLANTPAFNGTQFSNFSTLTMAGDTLINGGFTNANVGNALVVKGHTVTAPVKLSSGNLTFESTKLIADTLALSSGASLALNQRSQLQTNSSQLFNAAASSTLPEGYNDTGARISFKDSTLILTDDAYQLEYVKGVSSLLDSAKGNTLVMLGTLQNAANVAGTANVTDAATTGAVLANTQVMASKNQLFIGGAENSISSNAITVRNGFGASQLMFEGEGAPSVSIGGDQTLTLTGAAGALIDVAGAPDTPVAMTVENGTLNLGMTAMPNVKSHLTGTVTVAPEGTMNIVAGDHTITSGSAGAGIINSGRVSVQQQATLHADMTLQEQSHLVVNGTLLASQLSASEASQITVGDLTSAGTLSATRLDLQGARMFIDPAWTQEGTIADASRVVSGGTEINGRVTVGQNALLVLGDSNAASAEARFAESGLTWGMNDITAAVAIQAPQYLNATQGGLRVDGSLTGSAGNYDADYNKADFADHSLLMVSSKEISHGQAALNATQGSLNVANNAMLYVADAKANQTYTIAKGFSDVTIAGNGWNQQNLQLNKLLTATTQAEEGEVRVTTKARTAQEVMPGIVTPHALNALIASGDNDRSARQAGQRYLSVAIDTPEIGAKQVVNAVNSAAQMATAGGVQHNTWAVGNAAVDAVLERNAVADPELAGSTSDAGVWVNVLYGNPRSSDLRASGERYGQSTDFYGLILGADKTWESDVGTLRSGAAFHAGNGDSDSRGDFSATHNDFDFWGVSLYQNWQQANWNVTGDMSLTQTSSDVTQKQPGWIEAGDKLHADVDGRLFSAGLRGEYLIENRIVDVIPHVGIRFNQLTTKAFDTKNNQHDALFHTDKGTQNIWQFPVGVKLAKTFALDSGWNLRTQADVALVTVAGDRDSENRLHTVGIRSSDIISAEVMDETAFNGQLGVKVQKGNMAFGLGYNVNASQHNTDQTVSATWSLAF